MSIGNIKVDMCTNPKVLRGNLGSALDGLIVCASDCRNYVRSNNVQGDKLDGVGYL